MKKFWSILCAVAMMATMLLTVVVLPATAESDPEIGWVADFSQSNWENWKTSYHNGAEQGSGDLTGSWLFNPPTNVSADGISGTVAVKSAGPNLFGIKIAADFTKYNKLVMKGTMVNFAAARVTVHNGTKVNGAWVGHDASADATIITDLAATRTVAEDGSFFWIVDLADFSTADHIWAQFGWWLENGSVTFDYIVLANSDVTDEATAAAALSAYKYDGAEVGWVADFSPSNLKNWGVDNHTSAWTGHYLSTDEAGMYNNCFRGVENISADGTSAKITTKAADNAELFGTKIEADFSKYNRLILKGTMTNFTSSRIIVHDGSALNSGWGSSAVPDATHKVWLYDGATATVSINEDGSFFWIVDLADFADAASIWFQAGWFVASGTVTFDYIALCSKPVDDAAYVRTLISEYLYDGAEVGWVADFSEKNLKNWTSDDHANSWGNPAGYLSTDAPGGHNNLFAGVTNISADGTSATVSTKCAHVNLLGTKIEADFSKYDKLIVKGTSTTYEPRFSLHNGTLLASNWGASPVQDATVKVDPVVSFNDDGTFYWIVDLSSFAGSDYAWFQYGWFLAGTSNVGTVTFDYIALCSKPVDDAAFARTLIDDYLKTTCIVVNNEGASVRGEDEAGNTALRFGFTLNCAGVGYAADDPDASGDYSRALTENSTVTIAGKAYQITDFGALVSAKADLDLMMADLNETNGKKIVKVPAINLYEVADGSVTYTAVITNVSADKKDVQLYARAYVEYVDETGATQYTYGEKINRSVNDVALPE